jgi:hypothetical protein
MLRMEPRSSSPKTDTSLTDVYRFILPE